MVTSKDSHSFGKKQQPHVLILAKGDKIRHVTISPLIALTAIGAITLFSISIISAGGYIFYKDDILAASIARQTRLQQDYESRIAALRMQVDTLTSKQFKNQQIVEKKMVELLEKQEELSSRDSKIDAIVGKTADSASTSEELDRTITHSIMPEKKASMMINTSPFDMILKGSAHPIERSSQPVLASKKTTKVESVLDAVDANLASLEESQLIRISELTLTTSQKAKALGLALRKAGFKDILDSETSIGGPFIEPLNLTAPFDDHLNELSIAVDQYSTVKTAAEKLPFGHPAPNQPLNSTYGNRIDPFFNTMALHAGVDFRASTGDPVYATGLGKVVFTGNSGGYGKLVEIDHGKGYTTRYAHLSHISVSEGYIIKLGEPIGLAGNTGRSTGPHVHYEIRKNDAAINPMRFINAGKEVLTLLN